MVHQCPRCELRFVSEGELTAHLGEDHGVDAQRFERYRYPAGKESLAPLYTEAGSDTDSRRRFLVVANQTLGGEALTEQVRARLADHPGSLFYVVVPATHSAHYAAAASTGEEAAAPAPTPDERGVAEAKGRLRHALEQFRRVGAEVAGEVGPPDPIEAVEAVLRREEFDEVLVSTLPPGISRWLGLDLPRRLERRWHVPVSTVVVGEPQTGPLAT